MKVQHTKTKYFFSARMDVYVKNIWIEFARDTNGKVRADVYDSDVRTILWHTYGVSRRSLRVAKLVADVYFNRALPERQAALDARRAGKEEK